jgi:hypothetical protein
MQMFRSVKNTTTAIGWLMTSGHSLFGKHELRQIKHLIGDLEHPHIFTTMLASVRQYLIFLFQFVGTFNLIDFSQFNSFKYV